MSALNSDTNFSGSYTASTVRDANGAATGFVVNANNGGTVDFATSRSLRTTPRHADFGARRDVGIGRCQHRHQVRHGRPRPACDQDDRRADRQVSSARSNLGAIQNRFDHAINVTNVAKENLTAAKSRITDPVDMAEEMVKYTRDNILSQAGTSMLAQATRARRASCRCSASRIGRHRRGAVRVLLGGGAHPSGLTAVVRPHLDPSTAGEPAMSATSATSTSLAIDGLVSGLKTSDLINSLMSIEQVPQTLLKSKVTTTNSFISSLQTINGLVQSLATKASAPPEDELARRVLRVVERHERHGLDERLGHAGFRLVHRRADRRRTGGRHRRDVVLGGHRVAADVHQARRHEHDGDAEVGVARRHGHGDQRFRRRVTATKVAAGTDASGTKLYRLQLTSTATGAANGFTLHRGPPPTSPRAPPPTCSPSPVPRW